MELEENQIGAINHGHPVMVNQQLKIINSSYAAVFGFFVIQK